MEKVILAVLAFLFTWHMGTAQDAAEVVAFKAEELNGKVKLSWTIKAGGTCNGIGIQRAVEGGGFVQVGSLEGVCGNLSFPTFYEYTDAEPVENRINTYRLDLGGSGFSDTVSIEVIVLGKDNYLIFGNPLESKSRLFFRNDTAAEISIQFYTLNGELDLEYTTNAKWIELNRSDFGPSGMRIFKVTSAISGTVIEGRLLVN
jgi:hypothetical protein